MSPVKTFPLSSPTSWATTVQVYRVFIRNYSLNLTCGLKPSASVQVEIDGILHQETAAVTDSMTHS